MDKNSDPWSIEFVTPFTSLTAKFENFDKTKSSSSKRKSFNRARKWISDLLKKPFKISENEKLRHIDIVLAQDMTKALAMPGGVTYDDYLRSCLAPLPAQSHVQTSHIREVSEDALRLNDDEHFQDAEDNSSTPDMVSDGKNFICDTCDSVFSENDQLKTHMNTVHEGKNSFNCAVCESVFPGKDQLVSHVNSAHKGKNSFKCEICGCEFAEYEGLKRHKEAAHKMTENSKSPTKISSVKCNVCGKNLMNENELKNHIATAHGASTSSATNGDTLVTGNSSINLKPVCKFVWLNENCKTQDCPRAHPPRCSNPDCLIMDRGLPRWRILQCRDWHGRPKEKRKNIKNYQFFKPQTRVNRREHKFQSTVSWGPPMQSSHSQPSLANIPVWQEFAPSQNQYVKPDPTYNPYQF